MSFRRNGGEDEYLRSPFKRVYRVACPYPNCGVMFGNIERVREHLENVHGIWPNEQGKHMVPKKL